MPDFLKEIVTGFGKLLPVLLLSATGGAVAYLNKPKEQFSFWFLLIGTLTAAFVGVIVHLLLQSTGFPEGIKSAAIAISGYASRDVLFLLKVRLLKEGKKIL